MGLKQSYFTIYNKRNRKSAIATLADKTGMRIIFPFYHVVSDEPVQHINYLYKVKTTKQFIADLNFYWKIIYHLQSMIIKTETTIRKKLFCIKFR